MTNTQMHDDARPAGAPPRGQDDRRSEVDPASNPAPASPQPDQDAVRRAEDALESIVPK